MDETTQDEAIVGGRIAGKPLTTGSQKEEDDVDNSGHADHKSERRVNRKHDASGIRSARG